MSSRRFERSQRCPLFVRFHHVEKPTETPVARGQRGYQLPDDWSRKCEVLASEGRRVPSRVGGPHHEGMEMWKSLGIRRAHPGQ